MPSTSSSRHVIPPKTWRKPYEYFLNREKYQTIARDEDDYTDRPFAFSYIIQSEPNKLFDKALLNIISNDTNTTKFDSTKHCDKDQLYAQTIYTIATALRYLPQNINASKRKPIIFKVPILKKSIYHTKLQ